MKQYNTALYMRLSHSDELLGESGSISTQRDMLTQYCKEQNMCIVGEYVDDGWSGTNFDRPSFQRMIDDIEDGKINCVITKDLSRLGRDHIITDQYMEIYFPSKGVRYIALSDNIDTQNEFNEIAPILNFFNEMYARQTSKKVKAAFHTRFLGGAHYGAYAPIGYKKDPENKGKIIPDEETRWIVEKIFDLAAHGAGAAKIRSTLDRERIPTPAWLNFQRYGTFAHIFEGQPESKRYRWTTGHVKEILSNEVYIGNSVHNRQTNISFKNKKKIRKPQEEWLRVENTHEPIISMELWEQVQEHITSRKRTTKSGETQIFAGLLKCSDCGWNLRYMHNYPTATRKERKHYCCDRYSVYSKNACTMHYIRYDTLYVAVLGRLQYWIAEAHRKSDNELLNRLLKSGDEQRTAEIKRVKKELANADKRLKELDNLLLKAYEDRAQGTITDRTFNMVIGKYQTEQEQLEEKIKDCRKKLDNATYQSDGAEKWIKLIRKYTELTELTAPLLNELIEKIIVHEAEKQKNGERLQEIEIFYRFVGKID